MRERRGTGTVSDVFHLEDAQVRLPLVVDRRTAGSRVSQLLHAQEHDLGRLIEAGDVEISAGERRIECAEADVERQRFVGKPLPMGVHRRNHRLGSDNSDDDPILILQAGFLPQVLQAAIQIAHVALSAKFRIDREVDRDHEAALRRDAGVVAERLVVQREIVLGMSCPAACTRVPSRDSV